MNRTTQHNRSNRRNRRMRLGIAGLLSTLTVVGGTLALGATTASAAYPAQTVQANLVEGQGAGNDFSYTAAGQPMARNVSVSADDFDPNTAVSVTWSDAIGGSQSVTSMTAGPPNSEGTTTASTTITGIPSSACGRTLQLTFQGSAGVVVFDPNYEIDYSTPNPVQQTTTVTENCGPQVWLTGGNNGSYAGFAGDGFTPGGQVAVSGSGPDLTSQRCMILDGRSTCSSRPWIQMVTATTTIFRFVCFGFPGLRCYSVIAQGGGSISVTFPKPTPACGGADSFTAFDSSTGLSATWNDAQSCNPLG